MTCSPAAPTVAGEVLLMIVPPRGPLWYYLGRRSAGMLSAAPVWS